MFPAAAAAAAVVVDVVVGKAGATSAAVTYAVAAATAVAGSTASVVAFTARASVDAVFAAAAPRVPATYLETVGHRTWLRVKVLTYVSRMCTVLATCCVELVCGQT